MPSLRDTRNRLRNNGLKGFTLVELIVVIVIIAILVAALTPAVLSVINRANRAADEADVRLVLMAGSVAGSLQSPPGVPPVASNAAKSGIADQFSGVTNIQQGKYTIFFEGPIAIGCSLEAATSRCGQKVDIGTVSDISLTDVNQVTITIGEDSSGHITIS